MASGLLRVSGTIDLAQFWPVGTSDADTTKIKVNTAGGKFEFRPHPGAPFQQTTALDNAIVRGAVTKLAVDPKTGQITVRLQGIDAPELHYRPQAALKVKDQSKKQHELYLAWNFDYRQCLGETATIALANYLHQVGPDPLPCRVETQVDDPSEVFDTYGRFVGDIHVTSDAQDVNVNRWLLEKGWAFPAFYTSMADSEITALTDLANVAYDANAGVWADLDDYADSLDFNLRFRGKGAAPNPAADKGPVLFPKLFRRLSAWAVNKKATMVSGSFLSYLKAKPDPCYLTDDFLAQGPTASTPRKLDEFVESDGFFNVWPEQLVFQEKPSRVTGPGGAPVTW